MEVVKINVVPNVEVVSIQITSFPNKISYIVGETFNSYGLVVSANYSDGSSKDVTNKVTLLNTNLDSEGTKTITVSYTYKEITVETSFSVFVRSSGGEEIPHQRVLEAVEEILLPQVLSYLR